MCPEGDILIGSVTIEVRRYVGFRGTKHSSLPQTHLLTLLGSYIVREVYSEGVKSLEIRQGFIRTQYQGYTTLLENKISAPKDARLPLFATSA
ncbi:hypothetical protein BT67DRAFT_440704 [Trichocladium antarcticum]|uniref:Uncharacterized protein n=1 Tax=Trichocladium antarcticum TaxID=1450529 RepID=A0AAN6UMW2_9PEZI|nr:hypothetical protein BT67DRAFT_440704 [Trichocladium antarcticum]